MVSLAGVSKRYGSQVVLHEVAWSVPLGARVGLTGPNGAVKSTLLKILAGKLEPDAGTIALPRGARVDYLPQHILGLGGMSVLDHALATVDPQHDDYATIMDRYMAVCEEWDHRGRYDIESETETVLHGLGFTDDDLDRDLAALSGGWQMRAALAQLLLRRPDVLLLDEPTNYLDLEARTWLEEFLAAYPGTIIMVAHDRYFLDVT